MPVIFLGDVALDQPSQSDISFDHELVIANLEGAIIDEDRRSDRVVYNCPETIRFLKKTGVNAVTLANNHIYDVGQDLGETFKSLDEMDILYTGAGSSVDQACKPLAKTVDGKDVVVFGAGWSVIGCPKASKNRGGVAPLNPNLLFRLLEQTLTENENSKVIFFLHWNYELELYPQPAHRQLAFELIKRGAAAVIGAHSHCVQGIETVDDGVIVHGLGNWMFPHCRYFNGKLKFPDFAREQMAFQLDVLNKDHQVLWYDFDQNNDIIYKHSTGLESDRIAELTPFQGMDSSEYLSWFRKNRRKKKLLPVYVDYRHVFRNFLKDKFVLGRQIILDKAVEFGLKGAPK